MNVNLFVFLFLWNTIQFLQLLWTDTVNVAAITRLPFEDQL